MRLRLTLLLAASAFAAALLGITHAGEASTQAPQGAFRTFRIVTVSGTVTSSWTLGWTEQGPGCTTTGNGSGSESIRFQSVRPGTQPRVLVRGRQVYIRPGPVEGPATGSVMRDGDFTLSRSGAQCSETRAAPKEGCGTVDFSGATRYFFARGGGLIFYPGAIRRMAPETRTCVSSFLPDAGVHGGCCQIDDRNSRDSGYVLPPRKWSNKNNFRLTGRGTLQYPLRRVDRNVRAGTITVSYQWTATFTRAGRGSGR